MLIIQASRFRTQERNRQDALERLVQLVRRAAEKPKRRVKTRPTRASKERQLAKKKRRARIKKLRRIVTGEDA
jgi:ribosome-associated protein